MAKVSGSQYQDLARPPLVERMLRRALVIPGGVWTDLRVVPETGSTNADLSAAARIGAGEGLILVAEHQHSGRGRLDRVWQAPPRAGLTFSVLLRPPAELMATHIGWLPLLAGVALAEAVGPLAEVEVGLKWPNDLLVRPHPDDPSHPDDSPGPDDRSDAEAYRAYRKCGGILSEVVGDGGHPAVVVGIGLNVSQRTDELPNASSLTVEPTSLALVRAACTDRDPLVRAILRSLAGWYQRWRDAGGDPAGSGLADVYRRHCVTVGRNVAIVAPDGEVVTGQASGVDGHGRLVVETADGRRCFAAGDIRHLR